MTIKASGRAALVLAAGLWICAAAPSQAADDSDNAATPVVKHIAPHLKKEAHRKPRNIDAAASSDSSALRSPQLPPSVANANAQLTADTPASKDAKAMTERASDIVQAAPDNTPAAAQQAPDGSVVSSDQLNDVDRALAAPVVQPAATPAQPEAAAPLEAQQAPANPPVVVAASGNNSTWDQTSLIGKIFIGFGALLTVASAARMFIA
jgi:hypothetical protein